LARNEGGFHSQSMEGHSHYSKGCLTSFLLKSFERMISLHIRTTIDPTQISEAQHAYTKGKSTESALHLVVSNIEKSLSQHGSEKAASQTRDDQWQKDSRHGRFCA